MRIVKEIFPQNSYFWTVALQFRINERSWYSFVFLNDRDTVSYYWTILMQFRITEWSWCSFVLLSDRDAVSYYWTILMQFRINERSWCHFVYLNSSVAFSNKWTLLVPNMYFPIFLPCIGTLKMSEKWRAQGAGRAGADQTIQFCELMKKWSARPYIHRIWALGKCVYWWYLENDGCDFRLSWQLV